MKRSIFNRELDDGELDVEQLAMANCAMLLSRVDDRSGHLLNGRIFKCKTCLREFGSFQALGGHRASHKRPKLTEKNKNNDNDENDDGGHVNNKKHVCGVCRQEFGTGQALGGHMRRHRSVMSTTDDVPGTLTEGNSVISSAEEEEVVPGVQKENNNTTIRLFGVFMNVTSPNNENEKGCNASTCDTVAGSGGMNLGLGW